MKIKAKVSGKGKERGSRRKEDSKKNMSDKGGKGQNIDTKAMLLKIGLCIFFALTFFVTLHVQDR